MMEVPPLGFSPLSSWTALAAYGWCMEKKSWGKIFDAMFMECQRQRLFHQEMKENYNSSKERFRWLDPTNCQNKTLLQDERQKKLMQSKMVEISTNRSMDQSFKRTGRGVCLEVQALQTQMFHWRIQPSMLLIKMVHLPPTTFDSSSKTCDHRGSSNGCRILHQTIQTQPKKGHSLFETYSDKDESMEEICLNSTE